MMNKKHLPPLGGGPVGHCCGLHLQVSDADPGQVFPPFKGGGLSHSRLRVCSPPPHDSEQRLHSPQAPQLPSIGLVFTNEKRIMIIPFVNCC